MSQKQYTKKILEKISRKTQKNGKQPEDQFDEQGYYISFDSLRDGVMETVNLVPFVVS